MIKKTVVTGFLIVSLILAVFHGLPETEAAMGKIVYAHNDGTQGTIWVMNEDGTNEHQVSTPAVGENDGDPCWSPDGTKIAYVHKDTTGKKAIWVMNADGTNPHQVSTPPSGKYDEHPAWSPDGTKIAFERGSGASWAIWVVNADGTNEQQLSTTGNIRIPRWSPDGSKIAYSYNYKIWVMNSDGTNPHQISTSWSYGADWSPDGTKFVYMNYVGGHYSIWVMNADGSNPHQVSTPGAYHDQNPTWSPDGTEIAYIHYNGSQWTIWVMNADGTNQHQVSTPPAGEHDYGGDWWGPAIISPVTIDFDPNTLNKKSKGKYVTVYIELPEGYDVSDIDLSTVLLNETVSPESKFFEVGDHDNDGIPDLMIKFLRASVIAILDPGDSVEIRIIGNLSDGTEFEGTDTIRVIGNI